MKLRIGQCYSLAWKGFAKWWIPLCLISGVIFVFEIVPQILVRTDMEKLKESITGLAMASSGSTDALLAMMSELQGQLMAIVMKIARFSLLAFPFIALLTVLLLMCANWATGSGHRERRHLGVLLYISFVHVVMACVKAVAFLFLFFPGVYLYIKLLFVSLIMLEEKKGWGEAIRISWQMTNGNWWPLFFLMVCNTVLQTAAGLITVVGVIPATGFANTARAAAFRMLLDDSSD